MTLDFLDYNDSSKVGNITVECAKQCGAFQCTVEYLFQRAVKCNFFLIFKLSFLCFSVVCCILVQFAVLQRSELYLSKVCNISV